MTDRLQPPQNPTLGKRKSDDDLGKQVAEERKTSKDTEARRKSDWQHKPIRQRKGYYCCQCDVERGLDKEGCCKACGHGPKACLDCLASRSKWAPRDM